MLYLRTLKPVLTKTRTKSRRASPKKTTRIKLPSLEKLAKELEALQKQVVIQLYGTDCYTCASKDLQGRNRQLGHMPWPRTKLSTPCKFDHRFTRIQCAGCNGPGGAGMHGTAMFRMLGEGISVGAMWEENIATKGKTYNREWYNNKIAEYTRIVSQ